MDQNQHPQSAEHQSFKDQFGLDPLTPEAMAYWKAIPPYLHGFFSWENVCSVAAARKHSLTEDELKELIQVDEVDENIGTQCQFPGCARKVTPVKGNLVDFTTGQAKTDRKSKEPVERGSYLLLVKPGEGPDYHLYCPEHAQYARQRPGQSPLPLQSLAAVRAKKAAMIAKWELDKGSRAQFDHEMGRDSRDRSGDRGFRGTGRPWQTQRW